MYLSTLLELVTPQLFAQTYATQDSLRASSDGIVCSFDGVGEFRIHAGGFVATNLADSAIKAGSIVDIKATMRTHPSGWGLAYREAVGAIVRKFKAILPVGMTDQAVIDRIAEESLNRRRVFNACVCKSRPLSDLPGGLALRANTELRGLLTVGGVSFLTSADIQSLEGKLRAIGIKEKLPKTSVLLIPYFSYSHSIACIELIQGKRNSQNIVIWLENKEVAIAGLLGMSDEHRCFMEVNLADTMTDIKSSIEDSVSFFSVMLNADGEGSGWLPRSFFFVKRSDNPIHLLTPAALVRNGSTCIVTNHPSTTGDHMSWSDAVAATVVRLLQDNDAVTPQVRLLLSTVRTDKTVKIKLKDTLEAMGRFSLLAELEAELRDGAIWEDAQGCLYSTPSGYLWEEQANKRFGGSLVSNFTVTPTYSVRYDTGELYRAMLVTVGSEEREVILSPTSFDTTKKFAERVEEAIALSGHPTVVSPSMFDFLHSRPILNWLFRSYTDLPIKLGTSYIGWNPTRTRFIGVGFYSTDGGVTKTDCMYRPGVDYLRYFRAAADGLESCPIFDGVPRELMKLVYQCAGIIVRSYSGHTLVPVTYLNDRNTRETLERIFSHTGQLRSIQLNKNMRAMGDLDCIQGYPYLAQGYNRSQAKACKAGMILLGEEGAQLDVYTPEVERLTGQVIRYIIEAVPAYLSKNCGPSFVPDTGIIPDRVLEEEGKKIIDEMPMNL